MNQRKATTKIQKNSIEESESESKKEENIRIKLIAQFPHVNQKERRRKKEDAIPFSPAKMHGPCLSLQSSKKYYQIHTTQPPEVNLLSEVTVHVTYASVAAGGSASAMSVSTCSVVC
jgi:hypothetical protein